MATASHPRWGRPIGSHPLSSDINSVTLSADSEFAGLEAIGKISQIVTESNTTFGLGSGIDISTIERALFLAQDPRKIRFLAHPPVISGCIALMKTVVGRSPRVTSPFSYEFGYFCFRLLVVSLNVCLLDRWNRLDEALATRDQSNQTAGHVLASIGVASAVHKQFEILVGGGDCDSILGWPTPGSNLRPRDTPLLLQSEITTLLGMIWDDRKLFLKALMLDNPVACGLSGLFFLFARCAAQERDFHRNPDGSPLKRKLYELALRYYLVQDISQVAPIVNVISSNACYGNWFSTPKHTDAEDSRLILSAFIKRISERGDSVELIIEDATKILRFAPLAADAQTQDLLPEVLKRTIEYGWLMLLAHENTGEIRVVIQSLLQALTWLISPPYGRSYSLAPLIQDQIVDTIREEELLDWVACAMYKLDPSPAGLGERGVQLINGFFVTLTKKISADKLQRGFREYATDWRKVYRHLKATGSSVNIPSQNYYNTCTNTWYQIAQFLGFERSLDGYELTECFNGRCPRAYTNDADGPRVACASCRNAVYCNDQCQAIGWKFGDYGKNHPHREQQFEQALSIGSTG